VRSPSECRQEFSTAFDQLSPRVFAYARRQCSATDAQDVVADTFLVAWRRWSEVPAEPLPWLLVVARNTIANLRRHERRTDALVDVAATLARIAGPADGADHTVIERDLLITAVAALSDLEREAVLLVAWDALSNRDAATVAGCSKRAFEVRLSRARQRLARALDDTPPTSSTPTRTGAERVGGRKES
jgi:RNA polymerase sigma-70 factor (ECF subfamily)